MLDPDGRQCVVDSMLLPSPLRDRLAEAGWQVRAGDPQRGLSDPVRGDRLACPACHQTRTAQAEAARTAHQEKINRPTVKEVDMSARLGDGWKLRQRAGDAEAHTWLLFHHGTFKGMVRRYHRVNGTWSKGWEALLGDDTGLFRHTATKAASWTDRSSHLWRSRDLAAWGIAAHPDFHTPNPAWASRRRAD